MAVKILSGGKINKPKLPESNLEEPSLPSRLLNQAFTGIVSAPSQFAQTIGRSLSDLSPSARGGRPDLVKDIYEGPTVTQQVRRGREKSAGYKEKSLEPQTFPEEVADLVYGDLPIIALTGGASSGAKLGASIGRAASVSTGMKGAEKLGFGPAGQLVGGLLGAKVGGDIKNKISNYYNNVKGAPTGLRPHLESIKDEAYTNSEKMFQGLEGDFSKTEEKLQKLINQTTKGIPTESKNIVQKKLLEAAEKVNKGKLSINEAINLKEDFNDLAYKSNYDKKATGMFKQAAHYLREFVKEEGSKHKGAYKTYRQAEDLNIILNSDKEVKNLILDYFKPSTFTSNGILKTLFKSSLGLAGTLPVAEFSKFLVKRPEARRYYYDIFKSLVKDDKTGALNALRKVVHIAEKEEKIAKTKGPRIKVLSGSKLAA